jgi:hypothetical protein
MAKIWPKGGLTTERWRKPLTKVADWVPVDALLAWIDTESGGIPTVTTSLGERGLFQVHPDEVSFLGLTDDEFQRLTTDINLALRTGVKQLKLYAFQTKKVLNAVGQDWHGRDFWKLNKLFHGAFSMPSASINAFVRVKGRGPDTWRELQTFALEEAAAGRDLVPGNPKGSAVLRALTASTFANAEKTGEASEIPERSRNVVSVVAPLLRTFGLMV